MSDAARSATVDLPAYEGLARLNSVEQESHAFWRLRSRIANRVIRQTISRSRLRVMLVVVLSVLFWVGLFLLFFEGFNFLLTYIGTSGPIHSQTVQAIYNVFFASLMVMLVFSSAIILYGGLFRSEETEFLLSLPIRCERIVLYKFQEAVFFSSWGFLLLGSPMLVAYGVVANSPWCYYALLLPMMGSFAYIPTGVGAIFCLLVVKWIPRIRLHAVGLAGFLIVVLGCIMAWSLLTGPRGDLLTASWFQDTIDRLKFSEHRLLPSWWLSTGLLEAARRPEYGEQPLPWAQAVMFLAVLLSNALVCHVAVVWLGGRVFRESFSGLFGLGRRRALLQLAWLDRLAMAITRPLAFQVRLLIVKDLRVFRRDPVQWSQFLIFFGLLALYFVNIRRFSYDVNYTGWVNMVSFLNLAVVGLILSTFTTRFIFPMISLEGSRFWILGLLPVERDAILWGKFLFAAVGSIIPCTSLILLSDLMLQIHHTSWLVVAIHQLICLLLCMGLSGIAVGLGAKMPDMREQSPSKIAAGFGGTLNLVLSAIYIVAVVMLTALPCHFYVAAQQSDLGGAAFNKQSLQIWLMAGTGTAICLGLLATILPMRMGFRAFREMEF
jgi:ABC-2 type transport system permease protein